MASSLDSAGGYPSAAAGYYGRPENLALAYQEVFTVIVRLRSNRQVVTDAELFRNTMRAALKNAEQDAVTRLGYTPEDVRLATFALVAFLDESILNLASPVFADWPRKPLQEELFGGHVAGEIFFQGLQRLLSRRDAQDLADLLEVYYLCLLLGFRGRYSLSGPEAVRPIVDAVAEKIRRVRGHSSELSPAWAPPAEAVRVRTSDPWSVRLLLAAAGCFLLAFILFVAFKISLSAGASDLSAIVTQSHR